MKTLLLLIILLASSCRCWECKLTEEAGYAHRTCDRELKRSYEATPMTDVTGKFIGYGDCRPAW